jgi:hypothetical protein
MCIQIQQQRKDTTESIVGTVEEIGAEEKEYLKKKEE